MVHFSDVGCSCKEHIHLFPIIIPCPLEIVCARRFCYHKTCSEIDSALSTNTEHSESWLREDPLQPAIGIKPNLQSIGTSFRLRFKNHYTQ